MTMDEALVKLKELERRCVEFINENETITSDQESQFLGDSGKLIWGNDIEDRIKELMHSSENDYKEYSKEDGNYLKELMEEYSEASEDAENMNLRE